MGAVKAPTIRRSQVMQAITTIGLDIAKSVFQVHGIDAEGNVTPDCVAGHIGLELANVALIVSRPNI
jgi:hypothetical protein